MLTHVGATGSVPATSPTATAGIGHLVGLDGVRGLSVMAVVVFHLWPERLPGGFLGVSVFFTLSGYLITRLLLVDHQAGTLSLRRFWGRRVRRLAPASLATLGVVTVVWWAADWWDDTVRGDVLAGVAQVANWRQIATGDRYGVDPTASPLLHLWSLSIEEQVYVVIPLLVLWAGVRRSVPAFAALVVVALAASIVHAGDPTTTYYGTHVRMGEVAMGALAAAIVHGMGRRGVAMRPGMRPGTQFIVGGAVVAGVVALAVVMATTSLATEAYSRGGLLAVSVLSTVVVDGVVAVAPLGRLLDVRPLRYLGHRSYGIYLFHWPLLIGLNRAGMTSWLVPWVTVAATLVLASVSLRWWETPIRERRWQWPVRRLAIPAVAAIVITALVVPTASPVVIDVEAAQREVERLLPATTVPVATSVPVVEPVIEPPRPGRWGIIGDSKALSLALGLTPADDPRVDLGAVVTALGCPLGRGGRVRDGVGSAPFEPVQDCDWSARLDEAVAQRGPVDAMLVYFGSWDVRERRVGDLGDRWLTFGDADYEAWLAAEADRLHELVLDAAADSIWWLTVPTDPAFGHPERFDAYNEFARRQAQHPSGCVGVIDLAAWFATDDHAAWALPDGIHTTWEPDGGTSRLVGDAYLVDAITEAIVAGQAAGCRDAPPDRRSSPLPPDRG
jgi:peptidoglycan/LPS O-acetylase OafA/YrhL